MESDFYLFVIFEDLGFMLCEDGVTKCGKMEVGEWTIYEKFTLKLTILRRNAEIRKHGITEE